MEPRKTKSDGTTNDNVNIELGNRKRRPYKKPLQSGTKKKSKSGVY